MPDINIPGGGGGGASSAGAMTLIADTTAAGSEGTVTISNIPSTYKALVAFVSVKTAAASGQTFNIRYNADASALYDYHYCTLGNTYSAGAAAGSTSFRIGTTIPGSALAWTTGRIDITDPAATDKQRSIMATSFRRTGLTAAEQNTEIATGVYQGTAVISSVSFIAGTSTFSSGSRFTLYGLS